jgi:hypothetical protein
VTIFLPASPKEPEGRILFTICFCRWRVIEQVSSTSGGAMVGIAVFANRQPTARAVMGNFNTPTAASTRFNDIWLLF